MQAYQRALSGTRSPLFTASPKQKENRGTSNENRSDWNLLLYSVVAGLDEGHLGDHRLALLPAHGQDHLRAFLAVLLGHIAHADRCAETSAKRAR
eukprot:1738006-Prorocentrum_lima.AAC.1